MYFDCKAYVFNVEDFRWNSDLSLSRLTFQRLNVIFSI